MGKHTILLIQSGGTSTRTYMDFASVGQAADGEWGGGPV
jgi:hypothetical protein